MRFLFLVNGSDGGAAAGRAAEFRRRLPDGWTTQCQFRPASKLKGVIQFVRAAVAFRPDLVYVMDTAYTGVLAGWTAKQLLGCRMITDTGDVAHALARSVGHYSRVQLTLIDAVERLAMRSDGVVVRGSRHLGLLQEQGIHRTCFLPDGVDLDRFKPMNSATLRSQLGLEGFLVMGIVGSMDWSERHEMCYGWDVVEALASLRDLPVKALIVGDGTGRQRLERRAAELGVRSRVHFAGFIAPHELCTYICAMDVCVSTQSNDIVGMVRTTGKLPLYLACGRYVVATDVGEAQQVVPGAGKLLPYKGVRDDAHPARLAAHVRELAGDQSALDVCARARQVARDRFDYDLLAVRMADFCTRVNASSRSGGPRAARKRVVEGE